jgi:hypothetical protein
VVCSSLHCYLLVEGIKKKGGYIYTFGGIAAPETAVRRRARVAMAVGVGRYIVGLGCGIVCRVELGVSTWMCK